LNIGALSASRTESCRKESRVPCRR
jgi:hypothetical protein